MTLFGAVVYVALGRWLVGLRSLPRAREAGFALLSLAAVYYYFFWEHCANPLFNVVFAAYIAAVSAQYVALCLWGERSGGLSWLAFLMPIALLVVLRYAPLAELAGRYSTSIRDRLIRDPGFTFSAVFVGVSYLAFRTSHLVLEVRNGVVPRPSYWAYLGFAFFAPILSIGPISPYSEYRRAFAAAGADRPAIPFGPAFFRVLTGAVKFKFLGPLLNQLTYSGLLLDGHPHLWLDLPIAAVAYYLYLYCNFSGFCDIAVGGAGLMGISIAENFANPFAARNMKDFWNRWHITLSQYMRDVVFSPLSKVLVRVVGPAHVNHAIAATIFVVFFLVGIWHGVTWNYAAFGIACGLGVAGNHYYTLALKKHLGRERFAAYNRNRLIRAAAVATTFVYVSASMFLFANDWAAMKTIAASLRTQ
jgi:D-alanyl-lipoteichoic acid acyltransferase DltB (MBOAT superfamily)